MMIHFIKQYSFLIALIMTSFSFGQSKVKEYIIEGNEYYNKGKYDNAEYAYKRAALEDPTSVKANYNLGNALFQQKRYKESITHFNRSAEIAKSSSEKHLAYHNAGNAYLEEQDYAKAVESFKHALKNDPHDESTRYNLAYAKKMLQKQQQNEKNNEQQKDSSNDQNKDNNQQDQKNQQQNKQQEQQQNKQDKQNQSNEVDQNKQDNKGGNPKNGGDNGSQKGHGNQQTPEIKQGSKGNGADQDNAPADLGEGMLKALQEQEARTQRRIIQQKAEKQGSKTSKDW